MSKIARSMQQAAAGAGGKPLQVNEVFNITNYYGNGGTKIINTGLDMTEGGMVMISKPFADSMYYYFDTERSVNQVMKIGRGEYTGSSGSDYQTNNYSGTDGKSTTLSGTLTSFNDNGFTLGSSGEVNTAATGLDHLYTAISFRRAPYFFDVIKYTGNGTQGRQIPHQLLQKPGMIWIKPMSVAEEFRVYHRAFNQTVNSNLSGTIDGQGFGQMAQNTWTSGWDGFNSTPPTSTHMTVGGPASNYQHNANGTEYIAYLFGHTDSGTSDATFLSNNKDIPKIQCHYYMGNGSSSHLSGPTVTTSWRPQFYLWKNTSDSGSMFMVDKYTGMNNISDDPNDYARTLHAKTKRDFSQNNQNFVTMTQGSGTFKIGYNGGSANDKHIGKSGHSVVYMAIRDDEGTEIPTSNSPVIFTSNIFGSNSGGNPEWNNGHRVDTALTQQPALAVGKTMPVDRNTALHSQFMGVYATDLRITSNGNNLSQQVHNGSNLSQKQVFKAGFFPTTYLHDLGSGFNSSNDYGFGFWTKRKGFHSFESYIGNNSANRSIPTSLGVKPEFVIVRPVTGSAVKYAYPMVFHKNMGDGVAAEANDYYMNFGDNEPRMLKTDFWSSTSYDSWSTAGVANYGVSYMYVGNETLISPNTDGKVNDSGHEYLMWLWATVPGVSKVGAYQSNNTSSVSVDCGFTSTSSNMTVLIKNMTRRQPWIFATVDSNGTNERMTQLQYVAGNDSDNSGSATGNALVTNGLTTFIDNENHIVKTSNGFQVTGTNAQVNYSTDRYIFVAWNQG